jgi:hypothetical protein
MLRLLFTQRPTPSPIFRPFPSRIAQHPRLFSTSFLLRRPTDPPSNPDGLRNNRDLFAQFSSPHADSTQTQPLSTAGTPVGVSRSDAELLSKLGDGSAASADVPSYAMVFTCKKCGERSAHKISKQGYHHGTVLITCPGCKGRHLMADHLKVRNLLRKEG